ncbi:glycosyltransferase family A protein [Cytobacillus gottheilii]|uniref:Glycosyltransferase family 2 protein n=1 Tax=Cytobacillus gottheilii TaxID=859144 RepID=A0ABX8FA74_9BACI|nr:glycosyltransferase family 2 protein [Cytobacillus gottheilii]QVY61293.1 glycosyltransferase family 2 protein [Cytobacillus gottheilii]
MFFTICIPTYNRAHTIIRALDSLNEQEFKDFEVVIIDDGSTDDTTQVINDYKKTASFEIRYFKKENGGKHTALNVGIKKARGEFFCILDSDDWFKAGALKEMYEECKKIADNDEFSGIMGRSMINGKSLIGNKFPDDPFISSYVDFHFFSGLKYGPFGDCCECNKTNILKQYHFPEPEEAKFVPEAYLFDQVGVKYKLLCTNRVYKNVEYLEEGISNTVDYKTKNIIGFLHHYVSRLDNVFPYVSNLPYKLKVIAWWRYWTAVKMDFNKTGPRVKHIPILGYIVRIGTPILNTLFKFYYKDLARKGR